jgi:hypothetical protein
VRKVQEGLGGTDEDNEHEHAHADGENGDDCAHRMVGGKRADKHGDRSDFNRDRTYQAKGPEQLGETASDRAQTRGLIGGDATDRVPEYKQQEEDEWSPGEKRAPKESSSLDVV